MMDERPTRTELKNRQEVVVEEGDCKIVPPDEFKHIVKSISQSLQYRNKTDAEFSAARRQVRKRLRNQLDAALLAVAEAKAQGDPTDPKVQAYWAKHYGRTAVLITNQIDMSALPPLPAKDMGTAIAKPAVERAALVQKRAEAAKQEHQALSKNGMLVVNQLVLPASLAQKKNDT